jgi:hypothetical protein
MDETKQYATALPIKFVGGPESCPAAGGGAHQVRVRDGVCALCGEEVCECSEDYGPCEQHSEVLVVREGASLHTADELAALLIHDLVDNGWAELSPFGADVLRDADEAFGRGERWLEDATLQESLFSVADQVESAAADVWVTHDDGYVIVRPHDDCPLLADGEPDPQPDEREHSSGWACVDCMMLLANGVTPEDWHPDAVAKWLADIEQSTLGAR